MLATIETIFENSCLQRMWIFYVLVCFFTKLSFQRWASTILLIIIYLFCIYIINLETLWGNLTVGFPISSSYFCYYFWIKTFLLRAFKTQTFYSEYTILDIGPWWVRIKKTTKFDQFGMYTTIITSLSESSERLRTVSSKLTHVLAYYVVKLLTIIVMYYVMDELTSLLLP